MIKTIVFDLGGVIIAQIKRYNKNDFREIFGKDATTFEEMLKDQKVDLNKGKTTSVEFLKKFKQATGNNRSVETLYEKWQDFYAKDVEEVNKKLLSQIIKLRKSYNVYMLTDTIDIHDEYNSKRGIYEMFDRVFKSYKEGFIKNEPKTFIDFLGKINRKPEEVIFIDDKEEYIKIAKTLGIHGILFKNNEQLSRKLSNLGIKF